MNDAELKKRLLAAFRGESTERLRVLSSDFLKLDQGAPEDEAHRLIESSYRELHSLKGAARAVGLGAVERFCQVFESFFSELKNKNLLPPKNVCAAMLGWLDVLEELMSREDESDSSLSNPSFAVALSQMQELTSYGVAVASADFFASPELVGKTGGPYAGGAAVATGSEGGDPCCSTEEVPEDVADETAAAAAQSGLVAHGLEDACRAAGEAVQKNGRSEGLPGNRAALNDSVRISSSFLTGLLLRTEELISSRNSQRARAREVLDLEKIFSGYHTFFQELHEQQQHSADEEELAVYADMGSRLDSFSRRLSQLSSDVQKDQWELSSKVGSLLGDFKNSMLLPFSSMTEMFPRVVRTLAAEHGKQCELNVSGESVRIDRRILEMLHDPLMHMVRNSVDHGIEPPAERAAAGKATMGHISFSITQTDRDVVKIVYADDGRGVDCDKLRARSVVQGLFSEEEAGRMDRRSILDLVFVSGISTSDIITDISGRGLGMAIVRDKIESLGGSVVVASPDGRGFRLVMNIPVALTSFRGIVVESGGSVFVVPKAGVRKVLLARQDDIATAGGRETIVYSGRPIPLVSLTDILELSSADTEKKSFPVLIMGKGRKTVGISMEDLLGEQDVMAKSMGPMLKRVRNVSGISMLGSGRLAPILHGPDMVRTALGISSGHRRQAFTHLIGVRERKTVLVAEDSITSRMLLKNVLEAAGYNVHTAVDGRDALNMIRQELPDILVSDVEMPHMDGFTLTASVRKMAQGGRLPIVLVTSLGSQEDRERGVEAGADAYIIKSSFDQGTLLDVIGRLIG
ncbi:hybrid sensor histidine kinase/response regulator [Maridesulfovibrio sp. FT414]|uniref:hybrid sensor histidine kinase/response regulator n=1 Tax=Maridesulfovibrio sp. FT414 TaxID=2979469 RepID=UPI003D801CEF